jgi:hypothetical protein
MREATILIAVALLTTNCGDAWRDDYDFEWHGETVSVYGYGHTEADVCGGSFAEIDGHTAMIMADLGLEDGPPSVYRWMTPETFDAVDPCPHASYGCAPGGEAIATLLPLMHEVTHTITQYIGSDGCPRLINEGLAQIYDGPGYATIDSGWWDGLDMTPREAIAIGFEWTLPWYANAFRFTSFLVETYGTVSVVDLCEALPIEPTLATWDEAVRSVYGVTLEQLLAAYEAYPRCSFEQMRARLWGCSGPADIVLTNAGDDFTIQTGCHDTQATNAGSGRVGDALLLRRLYVDREMIVEVTTRTAGDRVGPVPSYIVQECVPCSENPGVFVDDDHQLEPRHVLRPGMYEVSVYFDRRDAVELKVSVVDTK